MEKVSETTVQREFEVIYAWNYIEWGGAQIYFLSIIKNSPPNWKYTIQLPKNSKPDIIKFFEPYSVKFDFVETTLDAGDARGILQKIKRQWGRIKAEYKSYRHLKKQNLAGKILHIETAPWQSWIFLYFLSRQGNVFVTMHNAMPHYAPRWRKFLWSRRMNFLMKRERFHFFAANQNAIDSLKEYLEPKHWDKLILSRASINPREINNVLEQNVSRQDILTKHSLPTDKRIVLSVGQFIDRKGRWVFLEAAQRITKERGDVCFVWLTPQMPNEGELQKIADYGLHDSFRLILSASVGKNREDVLNFFRIADVFALASLWEGLPIAILEAMALGIPTISTDLNAIPEAVKNLETGVLVEIGNSRQLAEAIINLLDNKDLRDKLGEKGRDFVIDVFDERKAARVALENYEKCLNK